MNNLPHHLSLGQPTERQGLLFYNGNMSLTPIYMFCPKAPVRWLGVCDPVIDGFWSSLASVCIGMLPTSMGKKLFWVSMPGP